MIRTTLAAVTLLFAVSIGRAYAATTVHPGDTLDVQVLNYAAVVDDSNNRLAGLNAGTVIVSGDGSISIPVIGSLHVSGLTTSEIGALVASHLSDYVRDPSVHVRLLQQGQTIFLTGATTGTLQYLPGETLSSALGQLRSNLERDEGNALGPIDKNGGILSRSAIDLESIVVQRDGRNARPVNGVDLLASGAPGPQLQPDDTIIFASKPVRVFVKGEVAAPGTIYLYRGDTLEEALLEAGGPLPDASTKDGTLQRDGRETPLPLAGSALRQSSEYNDVITVRAAPHITVVGQVPTPGEFTLKNGSTLLSALYVAGGPTKWANVKDIQVVHDGTRTSYDLTGLQHGDLSSNVPLIDGDEVYVPEGHKIDASVFFNSIIGVIGSSYDLTHLH